MTGEQLKAEGQARAAKRAGNEWLTHAVATLKQYAERLYCEGVGQLTIDQFRSESGMPEPKNANAWGALPRSAVKAGVLIPTDRVRKAERPAAHVRIVRVWDINPAVL